MVESKVAQAEATMTGTIASTIAKEEGLVAAKTEPVKIEVKKTEGHYVKGGKEENTGTVENELQQIIFAINDTNIRGALENALKPYLAFEKQVNENMLPMMKNINVGPLLLQIAQAVETQATNPELEPESRQKISLELTNVYSSEHVVKAITGIEAIGKVNRVEKQTEMAGLIGNITVKQGEEVALRVAESLVSVLSKKGSGTALNAASCINIISTGAQAEFVLVAAEFVEKNPGLVKHLNKIATHATKPEKFTSGQALASAVLAIQSSQNQPEAAAELAKTAKNSHSPDHVVQMARNMLDRATKELGKNGTLAP
ncbi:hypothetical protein FJZ26_04405 [Candidatus Parvarchaeota archaeon]|nr:hypothetical protein [Candidatus Parvarchaeota archaeon]